MSLNSDVDVWICIHCTFAIMGYVCFVVVGAESTFTSFFVPSNC